MKNKKYLCHVLGPNSTPKHLFSKDEVLSRMRLSLCALLTLIDIKLEIIFRTCPTSLGG